MPGLTQNHAKTFAEPGSFRDWDSRVFDGGDRVLRALTAAGLADWEALAASTLFASRSAAGEIVGTSRADDETLAALRGHDPSADWVAALSHERLPFVSYPYEWTFSMLRDAALLQLGLTAESLTEGLTLKDASPYNVQWRGCQPVFVDVGSFERLQAGEPWAGYRQFCMLYLYPLLLESYRGVPFQPWLRGSVDGISPLDVRPLFTHRDLLRPGVLRHVVLHAGLERRYASSAAGVREELRAAGFDKRIVEANVARMVRLVSRLRSRAPGSTWEDYRRTSSYADEDALVKDEFVRRAVRCRRRLVWDLGCNDGRHTLIASEGAAYTVAVDSDRNVVDALYARLREADSRSILPLVVDLADPSPGIGWRNRERRTLAERGRPDLVLCLALVHHLSISRNIPLSQVVVWLRSMDCDVVVEFPARTDPMVQHLLAAKRLGAHPDYSRETFESLLRDSFEVVDTAELAGAMRTVYLVHPR